MPQFKDIHAKTVKKAARGNQAAIKSLYDSHVKAMMNVCYRMLNNIEEAEDILQESFCEAFTKLNTFRGESTFGAWLKRIVVNRCINEINKKKLELVYSDNTISIEDEEDVIDYDDRLLKVEKIKAALHVLPEGYRIVFSLYMIEGYDHNEIAEILNISVSTSKSQLARAKKKLIEIIKLGLN